MKITVTESVATGDDIEHPENLMVLPGVVPGFIPANTFQANGDSVHARMTFNVPGRNAQISLQVADASLLQVRDQPFKPGANSEVEVNLSLYRVSDTQLKFVASFNSDNVETQSERYAGSLNNGETLIEVPSFTCGIPFQPKAWTENAGDVVQTLLELWN